VRRNVQELPDHETIVDGVAAAFDRLLAATPVLGYVESTP